MNTAAKTLLAVAAAGIGSVSAMAFNIDIEYPAYKSGSGGEFTAITSPTTFASGYVAGVTFLDVGGKQGFSTFCLEKREHLDNVESYTGTVNLDGRALRGGVDEHDIAGNPAGDPLSLGTAWLYSQFAQGVLAGYFDDSDGTDRKAEAGILQNAIWALEDEIADPAAGVNKYFDLAVAQFADPQVSAAPGAYGVWPINVNLAGQSVRRQDVLVYIPTAVPDNGATLALLGIGVLGVAAARRQKNA